MKRWHVFVPDAPAAKAIYDDLKAKGFDPDHVHVFGRDKDALQAAGVPPTTEMEEAMVGGQGLGPLIAGIIGTTPPDPVIRQAERDLDVGQILVVIGFPADQAQALEEIVRSHPEARSPEVSAVPAG